MKTFEINKENLTRLSKNIKKHMKKENIAISHNQLLNILSAAFGYNDYNNFNKEIRKLNKIEVLELSNETYFKNTIELLGKINTQSDVENIFIVLSFRKILNYEIVYAFQLEKHHPNDYFLDINKIIEEISSKYENKNKFYEDNLFSNVLASFDINEDKYLFIKKILKEVSNENKKNLFIKKLNNWAEFEIKHHFKDTFKYKQMLDS